MPARLATLDSSLPRLVYLSRSSARLGIGNSPIAYTFCIRHARHRQISLYQTCAFIASCKRAAATICPRPCLQRKHAAAALSQADRAGPDQPIRAIQPAGRTRRPPTGCTRQTSDVRQHHRLMPLGGASQLVQHTVTLTRPLDVKRFYVFIF